MKCCITGVAGFLGSNLLARLLHEGHSVTGLDDLSHGAMANIEPHLTNKRFDFRRGDVRVAADVDAAAHGADVVVHLAAGKIPRYGKSLETLETNVLGGRNVLEACRKVKARAVLASTSDVYGMSPDLPFQEDGRIVLGSPHVRRWCYAASKLIDEHLAIAYGEEYGTETVSLRFFGSYGENQNVTWWGGPQSVFIAACLRGDEMEIHGDGQQTRSFTYVADTVDGIVRAMTTGAAAGKILNIGNDRPISIVDLAKMISSIVRPGEEPRLKHISYTTFGRYEDVRHRVPDIRLAEEVLGFRARVQLEEGLPRTAKWQARTEGLAFPATSRGVKIHFVIPALNERGNLEKLGTRLRAAAQVVGAESRVILVDDGSTDGTGEAAPAAFAPLPVTVVKHPRNLGVAAAFRSGFSACLADSPDDDLIATLEADNTSDVAELARLVDLARGGTDLVLASCYAPGGGVDGTTLFRVVLSGTANLMMKAWFGLRGLHTFSSFYRVYRVGPLRRVFAAADGNPLRESGFASVVELLVRCKAAGCSIAEVPVVLRSKERVGKSKMRIGRTILGYFRVMFALGPFACRVPRAATSESSPAKR